MTKDNHPNVQSFDTETTGLKLHEGAKVFAYCIGHWNGRVEVYRLDGTKQNNAAALHRLKIFFADVSIEKVCHNYKFDFSFVRQIVDVPEDTVWHDTMIMAQISRNDEVKYSLDYLAWKYGKYSCPEDAEVAEQAKVRGGYDKVDPKLMYKYQVLDGERTMALFRMYYPYLLANKKWWDEYRNEIALIVPTLVMEAHGILYDRKKADALRTWLEQETSTAQGLLNEIAGNQKRVDVFGKESYSHSINPDSPKDVTALLYDKLKLPVLRYTKTGRRSLKKDVLLELFHRVNNPALHAVLKYRSYRGGISKIEGFEKFLDKNNRIHPNINTNGAVATGRESCDKPNLQNISKENVNLDVTPYPVPLRQCFRAEPGCIMVFVDYAGIEMRLIIHATGEPELMKILQARGDVHHPTVQCFLGRAEADTLRDTDRKAYKAIRNTYKNVGFCVAYGGGSEKVSVVTGKPLQEVIGGDQEYRRRFSRIAWFSKSMSVQGARQGYIATAFGRRLYVPPEMSYITSNYLIQGTAAGILKRGQVRVQKLIDKKYRKAITMVLPIHDELVFSLRRSALSIFPEIRHEFSRILTDMPEIAVPLDCEWKMTTTNWTKTVEVKNE